MLQLQCAKASSLLGKACSDISMYQSSGDVLKHRIGAAPPKVPGSARGLICASTNTQVILEAAAQGPYFENCFSGVCQTKDVPPPSPLYSRRDNWVVQKRWSVHGLKWPGQLMVRACQCRRVINPKG